MAQLIESVSRWLINPRANPLAAWHMRTVANRLKKYGNLSLARVSLVFIDQILRFRSSLRCVDVDLFGSDFKIKVLLLINMF